MSSDNFNHVAATIAQTRTALGLTITKLPLKLKIKYCTMCLSDALCFLDSVPPTIVDFMYILGLWIDNKATDAMLFDAQERAYLWAMNPQSEKYHPIRDIIRYLYYLLVEFNSNATHSENAICCVFYCSALTKRSRKEYRDKLRLLIASLTETERLVYNLDRKD